VFFLLEVELLSEKSLYTSMPIYALWLFVAALCVLLVILPRRAR